MRLDGCATMSKKECCKICGTKDDENLRIGDRGECESSIALECLSAITVFSLLSLSITLVLKECYPQ